MAMGMAGLNMYENALSSYLTPEPMYFDEDEVYEKCEAPAEVEAKTKPMEKRKVLFEKGDRVVLTGRASGIGIGSIGVVCTPKVVNRWDSVAVDILRAHDFYTNALRKTSWSSGHDCYGRVDSRNGKYYGIWVDASYLRKENAVLDEDILLLM